MRKFTRGWNLNQFQTNVTTPKEMSGLTVIVRNNDVNNIRVLKKKMLNEGIMKEMRQMMGTKTI